MAQKTTFDKQEKTPKLSPYKTAKLKNFLYLCREVTKDFSFSKKLR